MRPSGGITPYLRHKKEMPKHMLAPAESPDSITLLGYMLKYL